MSTLAFFPWLRLSPGFSVGDFELIPYDRSSSTGPDAAAVDAILRPYEEVAGRSVRDATLLRVHPHGLTDDLTEAQIGAAFTFAQMLSFAGLGVRRFWTRADARGRPVRTNVRRGRTAAHRLPTPVPRDEFVQHRVLGFAPSRDPDPMRARTLFRGSENPAVHHEMPAPRWS